MPSDRTLQTRRTLPKAGHGGTPCQKAHGEYHNGEALATPGKKKSNFAHPKLSNFAHSKSLTLRVGQQEMGTMTRMASSTTVTARGQRADRPLRFVAIVTAICAAAMPAYADTTIANNITLTADADWRADGVVTVPQGVTVDLNGHTLWVSGLAGAGTFTSAVPDPTTFDLTTTDASKVSSPTVFAYAEITAANLFNNNYDRGEAAAADTNSRRIIVANENLPVIVDYDFGTATHVNSYKVYAGGYRGNESNQNNGHKRTAKHWKFYGSNDEGDDKGWTPLDERTVTDWDDKTAPDCKQFTFFNATGYRYYRMEILEPQDTSNGYLELVQLHREVRHRRRCALGQRRSARTWKGHACGQ